METGKLVKNGTHINKCLELIEDFRLVNYTSEKAIGQLQVCSITFTI